MQGRHVGARPSGYWDDSPELCNQQKNVSLEMPIQSGFQRYVSRHVKFCDARKAKKVFKFCSTKMNFRSTIRPPIKHCMAKR